MMIQSNDLPDRRPDPAGSDGPLVFPAHHLDDCGDGGVDAAVVIALPEAWDQLVLDNAVALQIGEGRFEPVSHLDPDLAFLHRHQEERPVVAPLLPEPPRRGHALGIVLERLAFQAGDDEDGNLRGVGRLQIAELRVQARDLLGGEQPSEVRHPVIEPGYIQPVTGAHLHQQRQADQNLEHRSPFLT